MSHWVWCQPFSCLIDKYRVSLCITCHRCSGGGCRPLKILLLFGCIPGPSVHCCYYKSEVLILSVLSCMTGKKWKLDLHSDTNLIFLALIKFFFPQNVQIPCAEVLNFWQPLLKEAVSGLRICQSGCVVFVCGCGISDCFNLVCVLWTEHAWNASSTSILFQGIQFAHSAWALVGNKVW